MKTGKDGIVRKAHPTMRLTFKQDKIRFVSLSHEVDWWELSVKLAMRGMENEDAPSYTSADLKEELS